MASSRNPKNPASATSGGRPELIDDDDILEADDDIVECLDEGDPEDFSEDTTGKHELVDDSLLGDGPVEPVEDPVESFAAHPVRRAEVEEYASGVHDPAGRPNGDPAGQVAPPAQPPWDEDTPESSEPAFEHTDAEKEPTGRVRMAFELEPVGRRRRSRRRPARSARDEGFIDEAERTPPEPRVPADPWNEEVTEARESTEVALEPAAVDLDSIEEDRTDPARDEVHWSALPQNQASALADVGPTRVEVVGQEPAPVQLDAKTLIFEDPSAGTGGGKPADLEVPFLVIVQGEEEGREIDLLRDEMIMGRGPDNDLVFPDIACSRRHAMLERQGDGWVVVDLGSGNGTLVNGKRIQREVLRDGDEIEIGNTVMQFNLPGAPPPDLEGTYPGGLVVRSATVTGASPMTSQRMGGFLTQLIADPQRKKLLVIGGGALGGIILLMLIIKLALPSGPPQPTPEEIRHQQARQDKIKFDAHLERTKVAVQQKNWKDALLEVQEARNYEPNNMLVKDYLATIQRERTAAAAMEQARMFAEQKQWDSSVAALGRIPPESEYSADALSLKKEIDRQLLEGLLREATDLFAAKQYNQALLKFDEIARRDPDNTEVSQFKIQCQEAIDQVSRKQAREERRNRDRTKQPKVRVNAEPRGNVTGQVLSLYKNGEIDRAIDKAEGGSQNASLLRSFKGAYEKGMALVKNTGQADQAIKALQAAANLDKKIAGGSGKYNEQLNAMLAKVYYLKGSESHTRELYPQAYKAYRSALRYDPEHKLSKTRLQELEKIAKKLYEEAYVIKSSDAERAILQLKTVMQIVPADHVYYGKAQKLKGRLQGPVGEDSSGSGF